LPSTTVSTANVKSKPVGDATGGGPETSALKKTHAHAAGCIFKSTKVHYLERGRGGSKTTLINRRNTSWAQLIIRGQKKLRASRTKLKAKNGGPRWRGLIGGPTPPKVRLGDDGGGGVTGAWLR